MSDSEFLSQASVTVAADAAEAKGPRNKVQDNSKKIRRKHKRQRLSTSVEWFADSAGQGKG